MRLRRFLPFASGGASAVARPFAPSWSERAERAERLAGEHPEASAPLGFYRRLLEIQEPLSEHRSLSRWRDRVAEPSGEGPALRLERLPVDRLVGEFRGFVEELVPEATSVLGRVGRDLLDGGSDLASRTLEGFLSEQGLEGPAGELECRPFQLAFFPRAFLQPVAEGLAALPREGTAAELEGEEEEGPDDAALLECPTCGHLPVTALMADEEQVENRRRLVCSLCAMAWPFPRLTCPSCGETEADRLSHHVAESWPHLRVEECESCRTYLKTADLRENGNAVPVVEDIASLELDVWADDRELRKLQPNVLGI